MTDSAPLSEVVAEHRYCGTGNACACGWGEHFKEVYPQVHRRFIRPLNLTSREALLAFPGYRIQLWSEHVAEVIGREVIQPIIEREPARMVLTTDQMEIVRRSLKEGTNDA